MAAHAAAHLVLILMVMFVMMVVAVLCGASSSDSCFSQTFLPPHLYV
jgi:hypothetical protein